MDKNYDSNWQEDLPFVSIELDITDTYAVYKSICFHLDKWIPGGDPYEQERLVMLKDFFYRMVLEYKFQVDD